MDRAVPAPVQHHHQEKGTTVVLLEISGIGEEDRTNPGLLVVGGNQQ
jgi:hypothetical protein